MTMQNFMADSVKTLMTSSKHTELVGEYMLFAKSTGQDLVLDNNICKIQDTIMENVTILKSAIKYLEDINNSIELNQLPN